MLSLAKSSAALFLAKSALLGTRVLTLLAIATLNHEQQFARVSYVVALAEMFRLLADWGTDTWSVRAVAIASTREERASIISAALAIKVTGSALAAGTIVAICVIQFSAPGIVLGLLASSLLFSSQIAGLTIAYFQAVNRIRELVVLGLPWMFTSIGVIATVIVSNSPLLALATLSAGELLTAVLLLMLLYREGVLSRAPRALADVKKVARACVPVAIFNLILGVYSKLDTIVLAQISASALATYTVANRLFLPFQVAVTAFGGVIYSSTSAALAEKRGTTRRFYRQDLPLTLAIAVLASAVLWIVGDAVIGRFLPHYRDALPTLGVLCALLCLSAFNSAVAGLVLAYGHFVAVLTIAAIDLICTATAMLLLASSEGSVGVAKALLMGAAVNSVLILAFAQFRLDRRRDRAITI